MSKKENDPTKVSSRETLINEITAQLSTALQKLKIQLGDKKFEKRARKAAKLLTDGIKLEDNNQSAKKLPDKKGVIKKALKIAPAKKKAAAKK